MLTVLTLRLAPCGINEVAEAAPACQSRPSRSVGPGTTDRTYYN
jgi:hypothetical protein